VKTLNLMVSLEGLNFPESEKDKPAQEYVSNVIKTTILVWAQQKQRGFTETDRRVYYKLCDALEKALADKAETVDLDDEYIGLIRKAFREAALMPDNLLRRVEENVTAVKDR
jgi:hypothetical protein